MRDEKIDVMKGILIIMVVWAHCSLPGSAFISLFHMPVFFMISGYCINSKYYETCQNVFIFIKKRLISLWFPYFCFNALGSLLNNFFVKIYFLPHSESKPLKIILVDILKTLFFRGGATNIGGATWFLRTLFEVSVVFIVIEYFLHICCKKVIVNKKEILLRIIRFLIISLCLFFAYKFQDISSKGFIDDCIKICFVLPLIYFGKIKLNICVVRGGGKILIMLVSFIILLAFSFLGELSIGFHKMADPFFYVFVSFLGWFFTYSISFFLVDLSFLFLFKRLLVQIGRASLFIMLFHFLVFKFVNLFIVFICKYDFSLISTFPTLKGNSLWGMLYVFSGVFCPFELYKLKEMYPKSKNQ